MENPRHFVAIFGGAVSGAEAAFQLTQRGIRCVVFEQNTLPYGKIEDGLPKWHVKLRDKEEGRINTKLNHPLVEYVPNVRLGKDIDFEEVAREWGFSAVLLATGAWRDRPLPVPGVDEYIDKGLVYQNPFIYWFNHYHEPGFEGDQYEILDNTIVVGGGLASIDVVKVLMMESVGRALQARGNDVSLFTLDRSIAKVLDELGLTLADLGLKGCTLYYRRRVKDMPLSPMETDTPEKLAKAERVREKILDNAQRKYLFTMKELHVPVDKLVEEGRLRGLVFQQTEIVDGRAKAIPGTEITVRSPMVISSIGSLPEMIDGIPSQWGIYKVLEDDCCRIEGFARAFALGNAVTGRGNINESLRHGRETTQHLVEDYLSEPEHALDHGLAEAEGRISAHMEALTERLDTIPYLSAEEMALLGNRVLRLQRASGYDGNYEKWVETHLPIRLEDMIEAQH